MVILVTTTFRKVNMCNSSAGKKESRFVLSNDISQLNQLNAFLEDLGHQWEIPLPIIMNINLVLEEVISNIVFYGLGDRTDEKIEIVFRHSDKQLVITVIDGGKAFDPTTVDIPDHLDKPAEERKVGGLGIHFMRTMMDEVSYKRLGNKNKLTLIKKTK